MATPSAGTAGTNPIARDFVRALNVLMRSMRFYGIDHQLTKIQLNDAWTRLQALQGEQGLLRIGVAGTKLLINGEPVPMGTAESGFVTLLSGLDVASIEFDTRATLEALRVFTSLLPTAKPETLQATLEENADKLQGIQLNKIRFYEQTGGGPGGGSGPGGGGPGGGGSGESATASETSTAPSPDTSVLASTQPAVVPATTGPAAPENEVAVKWIVDIAQRMNSLEPDAAKKDADKLELAPRALLDRLLNADADHATSQQDQGSLLKIAEHLALRFAADEFAKGKVGTGGVRQMFDRFGREITQLKTAFGQKIAKPEVAAKEQADELNRKFWASLPDKSKLSVLLSNDAWVIPPQDVQSFVQELVKRGEEQVATQVVKTYCACVNHEEAEARAKAAVGVAVMSETIHNCGPDASTQITFTVAGRLATETDNDVQAKVALAVVKLVQEACTRRSFRPIEQVLAALAHIEQKNPTLAKELRPRVRLENRLPEFIREAITQPRFPDGLMPVLKRMPAATLAVIVTEFGKRTRRDECDSLAEIVRGLGPSAQERLVEMLRSGPVNEASTTVGLLCSLSMRLVTELLPSRLKTWSPLQQAAVIRQVAASSAEDRGELLSTLLDSVDLTVLPLVIDELSFDQRAAGLDRVRATASEEEIAPYIRLKAIEALGRFHDQDSVSLLRAIVLERKMFGWQYHDEMRMTALHALHLIDPKTRTDAELNRAFKPKEQQLCEHYCEPVQRWLRQRRYPRFAPDHPLEAQTSTSKGPSPISIERLSLGGGVAQRQSHVQIGPDGMLEVQAGFKRFKARVMIQDLGARRVIFEIVDMALDDRWRLRQLLNEQHLAVAPAATVAPPPDVDQGPGAFDDQRYRA